MSSYFKCCFSCFGVCFANTKRMSVSVVSFEWKKNYVVLRFVVMRGHFKFKSPKKAKIRKLISTVHSLIYTSKLNCSV